MIPQELIQKGRFWTKGVMLVTGCTKVSEGCAHCWSEKAHAIRCNNPAVEGIYSKDLLDDGRFNGKVQFNLRLLEAAAKAQKPQKISIWNDLYHPGVELSQITKAHQIMGEAKHHTFLLNTKRIERAAQDGFFYGVHGLGRHGLPDNIWHIVTAENQARADERIPHLLRIPGKRGIIIELMLGSVDIKVDCIRCQHYTDAECPSSNSACNMRPPIHQVILGGETGTGARPMHPDWARSVRDQCQAAGVPFFFKAHGAYVKIEPSEGDFRPSPKHYRILDGKEHNALAWNEEES